MGRSMLVALSLLVLSAPVAAESPDRAVAPCRPRVAERLGFSFVEVCADRASDVLGDEEGDRSLAAFWIMAAPASCSAGDHETIDCPLVTPLERRGGAAPISSVRVARVDGNTAHRLCAMRFGGRLPTLSEREQARHQLGITSLVAASGGAEGSLRLGELPEWVEEGACDNPSFPGSGCRFNLFPPVVVDEGRGGGLWACTAVSADEGRTEPAITVGGLCPAKGCLVAVPRVATPSRFRVACAPAPASARSAEPRPSGEVAAFRCVVPPHALDPQAPPRATPPLAPPARTVAPPKVRPNH